MYRDITTTEEMTDAVIDFFRINKFAIAMDILRRYLPCDVRK